MPTDCTCLRTCPMHAAALAAPEPDRPTPDRGLREALEVTSNHRPFTDDAGQCQMCRELWPCPVSRLRAAASEAAALDVEPALYPDSAYNTLRRAGMGDRQARHLVPEILAAAITGERHDLDDDRLTVDQRSRLAHLAATPATEPQP